MSVAGPSRVPPSGRLAHRERVESTYEEDLLGLLNQLSIDEMDEMQTFFANRARAGNALSDHDVAMNDLLQQARALAVLNQDSVLAHQIAAGEDVHPVQGQVQAPNATPRANDNTNRTAAQRNVNQRQGAQAARNGTLPSKTWGGWFSSVVDWAFGPNPASEPRPTNTGTGTTAPRAPRVVNRPTGHDCVICQDPIRGAEVRAPCGHYYDIGCVTDLFQSATRDETLYPPRCCRQNIPFAQVQLHLPQTLITTFQEKQVELGTLKRVYCSSPTCSRFLGPLSEGIFSSKVYTCPAPGCARRTCGKCREQHSGDWTHACRPDADAAQVLALSRASGWARCPGCSQMIELHLGCFHMTCRCRTEFCYLCRARWKTCACPQWDERRLLAAAEERVDAQLVGGARRNVPPPPPPLPQPARRVPVPAPLRHPHTQGLAAAVAVPVAPARQPTVQLVRPQPTPARTSTSPNAIGHAARLRPTILTSTQPTRPANPSTHASTSTSTSGTRTRQPKTDVDDMRRNMVREMMDRLRVDHDCSHERWRYRSGGGICQSCGHHLPLYLFRCQGCETLACNRCRRNRL